MRAQRKIIGAEPLGGLVVSMVVEQDCAEDRLFCVYRSRESALEADVGCGGHTNLLRMTQNTVERLLKVWTTGQQMRNGLSLDRTQLCHEIYQ